MGRSLHEVVPEAKPPAVAALVRRLVLAGLLAATAFGLVRVASDALGTASYTDCTNLAGECRGCANSSLCDSSD
jgi:hypothetical protein